MRKLPTWQTTRRALTATAVAAMVVGGAFLTSGTASAGTLLADKCSGSVTGNMGDRIVVPASAVSGMVQQAARESAKNLLILLNNGVDPDKLTKAIIDHGPLAVGQIPNAVGGSIGGDVVAGAVANVLSGNSALGNSDADRNATLEAIRNKVAGNCGLSTLAVNYSSSTSPRSDAPGAGGHGGTGISPGAPGTGQLLGAGSAAVPQRDYGNIPAATPGGFAVPPGVKYPEGSPLPGQQSPEFGILGADGSQPADVRNAGNADSFASSTTPSDVQLPMLLAVVALAGVTAALVRTWVLRKVA